MDDNQDDLRFLAYKLHIRDCVWQVQAEMSLGNINDEESLLEVIDRISQFESASEAFFFFQLSAPYEWSEYVTDELMKKHNYDLGLVAISVASMVVSCSVYSEISQTEGYRFLYEGKRTRWSYSVETKICRLKFTGDFNGWRFAIFKYSNENYDPDELFFPGMGLEDGTIKGAMAAGMEAYPL
ncbi:MAG: hypothetical protein HOC09_25635 [Deltaproteobacteria bacterium]|nr:hypothetical protein [Deltaproteobacteria bacterium]